MATASTEIVSKLMEELESISGKENLYGVFEVGTHAEQAIKYISFGSGRRGCPSANLVNILIGTPIGTMVQCFDWRFKGNTVNMEEAAGGMNLTMAHPLKCNPAARTMNFLASN
ncbi:hypothetical protein Bca52824_073669 [Brassica carinata]|uniref:Uncharacterized protein n=1 Tax=Brassica carinata TaxID=52824 RepID=A0A8X7QDE6_BRACI|nr:hypothetical protein Bca52824_073669 [Brassica carinata]